jgi:MFS family permease
MLIASRIGLGVGEAACYPVTLALVANWFALRERGKATAYWWIGTMIGPMLTGLIVTGLIVAVGWRGQFWAMGVLALALPLPMIWFLVRDKPEQHPAVNAAELNIVHAGAIEENEDAPGRILKSVSSVWRNHRFWLMVLAISCNAIFFWGWSIWLPTYLRTARHFAFSTSGYLTFVIYGFAVATILIIGHVSRIVRAAGRHIVRRNADAQRHRYSRHGQVARRARAADANDGRVVAGDDRLHSRPFGGWLSRAVRCALGGRRDLRRLHDRSHQGRILTWRYRACRA